VLPPLSHAGIIMQGGITGYDTNTRTGGIGARYLGIGADAKWVQDTVTVTLRAVSTNTGEVLSTVTVHKMIASYGIQGGAFRYVELDSILEAEAGVSQNEPKQIAVQQAIEKAVMSLIVEGAELGIWTFADPVLGQKVIADYRREKYADAPVLEAQVPPPPNTRNPAKVVPTEPFVPRVARTVRRAAPAAAPAAQTPPPPPPPPEEDETVGSLPAGAGAPPPAEPGETIGSAEPSGKGSRLPAAQPQQVAIVSARL
jgi:curli production assembly/transport component CsgG